MGNHRPRAGQRYIAIGCALALSAIAAADQPVRPVDARAPAAGLAVYLDANGRPIVPGSDTPRVTLPVRPGGAIAAVPIIEDAPGGGKMVRLNGSIVAMSTARVAPDGHVLIDCTDQAAGATGRDAAAAPQVAENR